MKTRSSLAFWLGVLLLLPLLGQAPAPSLPGLPAAVREAMLAGDTERTLTELRQMSAAEPALADTAMYLSAVALSQAERRGEALGVLDGLTRDHPRSTWSSKASFLRAEILRQERRFEEAAAIYEAEAVRLSGPARQSELAEIYLRFAEELAATPKTPQGRPDHARAAEIFARVLELGAPDAVRERAAYRRAQSIATLGNADATIRAYREYLADFDPTRNPRSAVGKPAWIFAARLALARAQLGAGDPSSARRTLEDLSADLRDAAAGQGPLGAAVRALPAEDLREVLALDGEAQYALPGTWFAAGNPPLGIAALERFVERFPDHGRALLARLDLGQALANSGRGEAALAAFDALLSLDAPPAPADPKEFARVQARALILKARTLASLARHEEARAAYAAYTVQHPSGSDWGEAQQGILESEYLVGQVLSEREEFDAAKRSWLEYLVRHPLDPRAAQILFDLGELDASVAALESTPPAEREARWRAAIATWRELEAKYANEFPEQVGRARLRIGEVLEFELFDFAGAIAAYKSCEGTPAAAQASQALRRMTEPQVSLTVERAALAGEPARVQVRVRNLESLQLETWRLDLEAYYRKNLTHADVESLDLDLISAQQKVDVPIVGFVPYKVIEQTIELDVEGPGAWVIAVTGGKLRSSALVLRSDLDLIVKSTPDEALVFVQDMARGEPAAGVRVLVAMGERKGGADPVVLEALSDAQGLARFALAPRASAGEVSVLCVRDGHYASRALGFRVEAVGKLLPRAVVYTDRPAYRPGETVHWRAILRGARAGHFVVEPGRKVELRLNDARGRNVRTQVLPQSEYGTLHGEFQLPDAGPLGTWQMALVLDEATTFNGDFLVAPFQLVHVELTAEFERAVYYRGEEAVALVHARYSHGGPVTDSPLSFVLPDGRTGETRTDAEGRARIAFATRELAQAQVLDLSVTLLHEPMTAAARAWLAFSEFSLEIDTARDVHATGDPFTVELHARSPDGDGLARELRLSVVRLEPRPKRAPVETRVSERQVTTDSEGRARPVVRIEKSGEYLVRVSATDRFGNPVEDQIHVEIVGDDDEVTLRLLADTDVLKAGEGARVEIAERGAGGLALVTFEAGSVADWRWIQLKPGKNALEFTVGDALAPEFVVAVAHQRRGTFRQAELAFRVERQLEIRLRPIADVVAPGTSSAIEIEVHDALGKPVQAELSLAIVDAALFQLYPDRMPSLRGLFDEPRLSAEASVATGSSTTFQYEGSTWEVSGEVLAEARRVVEEAQWSQDRKELAEKLSAKDAVDFEDALGESAMKAGLETYPGPSTPGAPSGGGGAFGGRRGGKRQLEAAPDAFTLPSPTAFWSGTIVTDAAGKARVTFDAPSISARWRATARAAAKDPRATSATAEFTTRAAFFVELRAPRSLVEGDLPRFAARLHNTGSAPLTAEVKLVLRGAGVELSLPGGSVEVPPGTREVTFPELGPKLQPGELGLSLQASATIAGVRTEVRDGARIPVAPWGVEFRASESGELTSVANFDLALPDDRKFTNLSLELAVGASLDAVLVSEALGVRRHVHWRAPSNDRGSLAADLYGSAEVLRHLARTGRDSSTEFARVRERVQGLTAELLAAQESDGTWRAGISGGEQHGEMNAMAMLALVAARDAGITVSPQAVEQGASALEQAHRAATSEERKALMQHALARWNRGDYGALNRLHRLRAELSNAALAHTALALAAIDRAPMAAEVAQVIETRAVFETPAPRHGCSWTIDKSLPWSRSRVGTAAFCVLALEAALPGSSALQGGVQYLTAHRPWTDSRTSGLALAALARHAGETVPASERFTVTASIDGGPARPIDVAQGGRLVLPIEAKAPAKVRVELRLSGRGAPHFVAILRGFSADVKPGPKRDFSAGELRVYAPEPRWRGKAIPTGFSSVRSGMNQWSNRVTHLPRGQSARAVAGVSRTNMRVPDHEQDWLVVEIPLPAGARILDTSSLRNLPSFEVLPDKLIAYLAPDRGSTMITFQLHGDVPGRYRVGPVVARSAGDPELLSIGAPSEFVVLPLESAIPDEYRATPDELYHLGMEAWKAGEKQLARETLTLLMKEFQADLRDDDANSPLQQAGSALFFLALEAEDAREIVRWFEVLREKRADLVIPFDKILAVARAYTGIDEHERALSILRATVEETFGVDLKVAGALEQNGDLSQALTLLARLWKEYPDAPPVLQTWLALSDKLLTWAPKASEDKSLSRDGRTRASLHRDGTRLLQWFLCLYPRDPQAPEAALNLISAHFGLEDYATASRLAQAFAARFSTPEFADAFLYSRAVAEWYLGNDEEALRVNERVATAVYTDASGVERPSKNRELAQYILAQIHHARRDVARAAEYYALVERSFADAKAALSELRAKSLSLDEVTRAKPGESVRLALRSKNVAEVELAIYPVDLMTLYLREGDLSKVAQVDLSGIAPELARTMKLQGKNALREVEEVLELALPRTGAYLVIARGGELFASGLVLVSELELDVGLDVQRGGVRVQVVDSRDGRYVRDVDVRVVGSADKKIQRAKTDLRGMVSLDGVVGQATIIARASGDRYAFYRGEAILGPTPADARQQVDKSKAVEQLSQEAYLSNVLELNSQNQSMRAGRLTEEIGRERKGVQIQQVK